MRRVIEVEQIAALVALKQGPQLGRQHFFPRERRDCGLAGEPRIFDAERKLDGRIVGFPLACVDFDLEPYRARRISVFGFDRIFELGRNRALIEARLAQPRIKNFMQMVQ